MRKSAISRVRAIHLVAGSTRLLQSPFPRNTFLPVAGEDAGLIEKTFALPVTGYINGKGGNVDLHFKLGLNERQFENMSSRDACFLWDVRLRSVARKPSDVD